MKELTADGPEGNKEYVEYLSNVARMLTCEELHVRCIFFNSTVFLARLL